MKKYKTWWLVAAYLSSFILFNWTMYGLFGVSLIGTKNFDQGVVQILIGVFSTLIALVTTIDDSHLKGMDG